MASQILRNLSRITNPVRLVPYSCAAYQVRYAGHSKWQNIKSTKTANDQARAKLISRYVMMVKRAVISGGYQGDPKLNSKLATLLAEAQKLSLPKATLERAIERALNVKVVSCSMCIEGPGKSSIIARCETENVSNLRREVRKAIRDFDANLLPDESIMNMFQSKGVIRASTIMTTSDRRPIDQDYAEEAAIMSNAEDVYLEDLGENEDSKAWVFNTDAINLDPCKGSLEKLGFKIISSELELVPFRTVDFGEDVYEKVGDIAKALRSHEQVIDVFHNVAEPKSD